MTSPKFTPGPWAICNGWPTVIVPAEDQSKIRGAAESESADAQYAQTIAVAHDDDFARTGWLHRFTREQSKANARLIAAAPELYAALAALLHEVTEAGFETARDYNWPGSIAEAKAALAKARGEP